jgi:hypothetical protein
MMEGINEITFLLYIVNLHISKSGPGYATSVVYQWCVVHCKSIRCQPHSSSLLLWMRASPEVSTHIDRHTKRKSPVTTERHG